MSLMCSCLNVDATNKYKGHTTVCILRLCQTVLSLSKNQESDSAKCISKTKTKPILMFLTECLKNVSENNNIVRQIVDILICHELWLLNDEDITQLLLKGTKTILIQSRRWNDIPPNLFIEFCVSKVKKDIDVPTMGLLQLLSEHDVTKDVVLRQYVSEILPKLVNKLIDETMNTRQNTFVSEKIRQRIFSFLSNAFKSEEGDDGNVLPSDNRCNDAFGIIYHQLKDFMWSTIALLDSTENASLKCDILDFLRQLCRLDVFVIESLGLILKDEPLILELLCVCKRKIQEKFTDQKIPGDNGSDTVTVFTVTMLQMKVLALLIDLMKTYIKITNTHNIRKISILPDYILRSDIVFFVRSTVMITQDNNLFNATIEFFSLLSTTPTFSSNRRMLEVLESSFNMVFMICRNKSYDPQLFIGFVTNVLKQHHIKQNFLRKDSPAVEPTLKIQQQIIGVFSQVSLHTNNTFIFQYAKLLSFCSSVEVCDSLWGVLVGFTKKLTESTTKNLTAFKIVLIIADVLMKWNRFMFFFGAHYSHPKELPEKSVEMHIVKIFNNTAILPYILTFIEVSNPLDDLEDSAYIEIMMKLLKLSVKLNGFKSCAKQKKSTSRVKVFLNGDNSRSIEVVVPSASKVLSEETSPGADSWTAETLMSVLELLQSKGRLCNEWFEIMAFVVVATVKAQMPWYDAEKDLSFFYGWKLFDAVKNLCEHTKKKHREDETNEIIELTRGKIIVCGMAELAVIYVTELLSPTRRNREYFSMNLKEENGFISQVLNGRIPKDEALFFYKAFLYILTNRDPKDINNALKYFPNVTTNFTEITSKLQTCDIQKIVTFEAPFFRYLFQNSSSEFMMTQLIEAWMKKDSAAAANFLVEISGEVDQSLRFIEMMEACLMQLVASGEPDCSNLAFGILASTRIIHNWGTLWNIFNTLIQKIIEEDETFALSNNRGEVDHISPNILNCSNIMKVITINSNRNFLHVKRIFCEDLMKITIKYSKYHNVGTLGLGVLNLCKSNIDLRSLFLANPQFMRFLEKRMNFCKGLSKETQLAFEIAAYIVESDADHSEGSCSGDQILKESGEPNVTISWALSSILPKLVYCGSMLSVAPFDFISALLKQNFKSSFVTVEELTSKDPRELSDILTNIYLYVHDVLQKPQEPDTEDSLWGAAYLILHYASQNESKGDFEKNEIETKRKYFQCNLIREHVWTRLSLALKLLIMDANDLSTWPENFLWFIKQWLQGHHMVLKDGKVKHEYFTECYQDLSFVKIVVTVFKTFRMYENNNSWPTRRERIEKNRKKVFLAHHIFVYCVLILKEFFTQIPNGSSDLLYFQHSEQVILTFIQNVDDEYLSKIRKIIS